MRQTLAALAAAFLSTLAFAAPAGLEACARCHGVDGIATDPATPHLAGLDAGYLSRQVAAFADGRRRQDDMSTLAGDIDAERLAPLLRWYASRPPFPAGDAARPGAAQTLYDEGRTQIGTPACVTCHQPDGVGNARFPRLAGQKKAYLVAQLEAFRSGRRGTDPAMTETARSLSAGDIRALADALGRD
ncbi:c-type cytochrome [Propionivibrio dicarboxylicus]|uniref:Cytochrome c553 n=1 Tax=Propionivibrio dicarboxylicus TaxID=83767 RepID=A0A1G8M9Y1_9RHOO|nr:c-type cytochrome [Propionivibrio dicarboxylicus]SDI64657.1 Cytochrome c553 [Propionivibrio dicarboxylicus]